MRRRHRITARGAAALLAGATLNLPGAVRAEPPEPVHRPAAMAAAPVVARLVAAFEATPERCTVPPAGDADARTMAAEIERFRARVPAAAGVPVDLRECFWDGMVVRGERIVVSSRLARATPAQRFFVIAHELGHLVGQHHARLAGLAAELLRRVPDEAAAALALARDEGPPLSRRHESEADAFAVQLMLQVGEDPEEAARFLEAAQRGAASTAATGTHPAPAARAAAIRAMAAGADAVAAAPRSAKAPPTFALRESGHADTGGLRE